MNTVEHLASEAEPTGAPHEAAGASAGRAEGSPLYGHIALAQGIIYIVTGVWPIVSPRSFQLVTGPKSER